MRGNRAHPFPSRASRLALGPDPADEDHRFKRLHLVVKQGRQGIRHHIVGKWMESSTWLGHHRRVVIGMVGCRNVAVVTNSSLLASNRFPDFPVGLGAYGRPQLSHSPG